MNNKRATINELFHKMLVDWDLTCQTRMPDVALAAWYKGVDRLMRESKSQGCTESDIALLKDKLKMYQAELGITAIRNEFVHQALRGARGDIAIRLKNRRLILEVKAEKCVDESYIHPPTRAEKFLYLVLPKNLREYVPGDLEEEFAQIARKFDLRFAKKWYWKQVISSALAVLVRQLTKLAGIAWLGKAASWLYGKLGS